MIAVFGVNCDPSHIKTRSVIPALAGVHNCASVRSVSPVMIEGTKWGERIVASGTLVSSMLGEPDSEIRHALFLDRLGWHPSLTGSLSHVRFPSQSRRLELKCCVARPPNLTKYCPIPRILPLFGGFWDTTQYVPPVFLRNTTRYHEYYHYYIYFNKIFVPDLSWKTGCSCATWRPAAGSLRLVR